MQIISALESNNYTAYGATTIALGDTALVSVSRFGWGRTGFAGSLCAGILAAGACNFAFFPQAAERSGSRTMMMRQNRLIPAPASVQFTRKPSSFCAGYFITKIKKQKRDGLHGFQT